MLQQHITICRKQYQASDGGAGGLPGKTEGQPACLYKHLRYSKGAGNYCPLSCSSVSGREWSIEDDERDRCHRFIASIDLVGDSKTRENCITDLFKGLFELVAYTVGVAHWQFSAVFFIHLFRYIFLGSDAILGAILLPRIFPVISPGRRLGCPS